MILHVWKEGRHGEESRRVVEPHLLFQKALCLDEFVPEVSSPVLKRDTEDHPIAVCGTQIGGFLALGTAGYKHGRLTKVVALAARGVDHQAGAVAEVGAEELLGDGAL